MNTIQAARQAIGPSKPAAYCQKHAEYLNTHNQCWEVS